MYDVQYYFTVHSFMRLNVYTNAMNAELVHTVSILACDITIRCGPYNLVCERHETWHSTETICTSLSIQHKNMKQVPFCIFMAFTFYNMQDRAQQVAVSTTITACREVFHHCTTICIIYQLCNIAVELQHNKHVVMSESCDTLLHQWNIPGKHANKVPNVWKFL